MRYYLFLPAIALASCSAPVPEDTRDLFTRLTALCGQSFQGRVVSEDERDADWAAQVLTIEIRSCTDDEIRIPLHVGENRSRTWVIRDTKRSRPCTEDEARLVQETLGGDLARNAHCNDRVMELKHDHRHEDGSEDVLTQYGGMTESWPLGGVAHFPADAFSRELFERENIPASMENVWTMRVEGDVLSYALDRPGRHFEAVFDLSQPVDTPPAPWGTEE